MGILLAIHVLVTVFLILIVLIQKNEGGGSLFANSGGGSMFNARGTSSIITKTTWVLATIFLVNCIVMASISATNIKNTQTIINEKKIKQNEGLVLEKTDENNIQSQKLDGKIATSSQSKNYKSDTVSKTQTISPKTDKSKKTEDKNNPKKEH